MSLAEIIIEKEKALLTFGVRSSIESLRSLLSSEFKEVGASGAYFGLSEVLECLPAEESWSCKTQDWEFRLLSIDIVQTIHRAFVVHFDGDEGTYSRRSSIWRKESNEWKMIYHQGTKVEPFEIKS
ncbi:MAG: DUF4440 domain-containing protein [Pseudomonadota bacterium]